jgi:thiol reductant ABC exporter CydD subunit
VTGRAVIRLRPADVPLGSVIVRATVSPRKRRGSTVEPGDPPLSSEPAPRRRRGPIDWRLLGAVAVARRYLWVAVGIGLAGTACVIAQAVLLADVIDRALLHGARLGQVTPQLVGLAVVFALRAVIAGAGELASQRTSGRVTVELRQRLLSQTLALGPTWLAGERAGELSLTATRGIGALDAYFGRYLPQAVLAGVAPLAILVWVAVTDWVSALVLVALVACVPVAMVSFGRRARVASERQWRRLSSLSAHLLELVQGLPTLRAFGRVELGRREVAEATDGVRQGTLRTLRVALLSALSLELLAGLGTGLVAMVLGLRLLDGTVGLSKALAVLLVSPEVFLPLRRAGAEFHASAEGQAAAGRVLDVLALPVAARAARAAPIPDVRSHPLALSGITVTYAGRARPVLEDFSLEVAAGERLALIGPSGAGKSTVLAVLLGFVAPGAGRVSVGGVDLSTTPIARWREQVSWVPQRPRLFRGSLADNLRLGDPAADVARLTEAAGMAGLDSVLARLPGGLDAPVGEGGLALSSGERQRVAIARAVLRDAPLVLFDEPDAHLDPSTRARLRQSLSPWLSGRTVIVAGHHPEIVGDPDRTVVLSAAAGVDPGAVAR